MNTSTIRFGSEPVKLIQKNWRAGPRLPYRKTYRMKPGQRWQETEETEDQWEHYVVQEDGKQIPVGAKIAQDLMTEGATAAAFVELWAGSCVLVSHELVCVSDDEELGNVLDRVRAACGGQLGGFPDVMGVFPDGKVAFRETKNIVSKDRLGPKQHAMADQLRKIFGASMDLAVVEWGV